MGIKKIVRMLLLILLGGAVIGTLVTGGFGAMAIAKIGILAGGIFAWRFFSKRRAGAGGAGNHLRGARLTDARGLDAILSREKRQSDFAIGNVRIPVEIETRGFLFAGAPGTGKSVAITSILDVLDQRGDGGFVADRSGIYAARYYSSERDIILNPFDARSIAWSPLAEMHDEYDADTIAKSLIPDASGDAGEWNRYAQNFVGGVLLHCWKTGATNREVVRLVQSAGLPELREILSGHAHASAGLLAEGNEKMFGSVRGIASTYTSALSRLPPDAARDAFSIRDWVARQGAGTAPGRRGRIFWNYQSNQIQPARALIAAQADIFSGAVVSLPPSASRRMWLVLDEFASLGRVASMEDFLTNARKYGGCAILGMQSISQVHSLYGRDNATSMLSSISTRLVLRAPDPETAEYSSKGMGDAQIVRTLRSGGSAESAGGDSAHENWSQQVATERVVLPAEIARLRDLTGYLSLSGDYPHAGVVLPLPETRADRAAAFEPAPPALQQADIPPQRQHQADDADAPAQGTPAPAAEFDF